MIKGKKISWFFKMILNVICIVVLFLPISTTYNPFQFEGDWETNYVYSDSSATQFLLPFYLLWGLYQFIKSSGFKILVRILLLTISGWILFLTFASIVLPIQDYVPEIGILVMSTIFPFLLIIFFFEYLEKSKSNEDVFEDVLDA